MILSAEIFARQENPALAARQILRIRPGALPLYTDGFSLWMNRLRDLLDDDGGGLDETTVSKLRSLKRTLGKWDRYVDLTGPTLTFPGADASSPQLSPMPSAGAEPDRAQGWLPIRPSSVLESVHQKWEAIKLDPIPQAPAADEKQQEISTQLVKSNRTIFRCMYPAIPQDQIRRKSSHHPRPRRAVERDRGGNERAAFSGRLIRSDVDSGLGDEPLVWVRRSRPALQNSDFRGPHPCDGSEELVHPRPERRAPPEKAH